ncbi:histone H1B [Diachasma alloeum]|uniref:histone H1B n=1 Tax=Diachasma alloeum TaxID=454923 RepID=UPI000738129D|nr:histone H1B [Diachasma alloeum]
MAEVTSPVAASAVKKVTKDPKPKPSHPSTSEMVFSAIKTLDDRKGSSLHAIKKYMIETYHADTERLAPYIKKYLKAAVESETIIQTKGKGATGSFKLPKDAGKAKPKPKVVNGSPKKAGKGRPAGKKAEADGQSKKASPKKAMQPAGDKKIGKPKADRSKSASPSKAKKTTKGPTAKPKVPKPKTSASPKVKKTTQKM